MGVEVNVNPEPVQPASTRIKNLVKWLLYNGPPDELLLRYSIQSDKLETERPALLNMTWKEHIPNITEYRNTLNYFCLAWGIIAGSMIPRPGQKLEDNPYFVDSPFIPDREKGHRLFSTSIMQKNISYTYQYDEYSGKVEIISQEYRGHRIHKIRVTLRENGPVNISETDFLQIPDLFGMQGDKIPLHFEKKNISLTTQLCISTN